MMVDPHVQKTHSLTRHANNVWQMSNFGYQTHAPTRTCATSNLHCFLATKPRDHAIWTACMYMSTDFRRALLYPVYLEPIMLVFFCSSLHRWHRKDIYYLYTTPSRSRRTLIVRMLEHFNLLWLMTGGRSKYILTNVPYNETLPESKALTPENHADVVRNLRKT